MTGGWAATNTLREALTVGNYSDRAETDAALALVEAALDAADLLLAAWDAPTTNAFAGQKRDRLAAALRAVREGK